MSITRFLMGMLLMATAIAAMGAAQVRADGSVLSSDLAFHFVCQGEDRTSLENAIARFLEDRKFRVLNQGQLQRNHGVMLDPVHIIGLDDQRRMIDFSALLRPTGRYAVTLRSPPPTNHNSELEDALTTFVADKLGCQVRQVSHSDNAANASPFYDAEVKRIEALFREADELEHGRRL